MKISTTAVLKSIKNEIDHFFSQASRDIKNFGVPFTPAYSVSKFDPPNIDLVHIAMTGDFELLKYTIQKCNELTILENKMGHYTGFAASPKREELLSYALSRGDTQILEHLLTQKIYSKSIQPKNLQLAVRFQNWQAFILVALHLGVSKKMDIYKLAEMEGGPVFAQVLRTKLLENEDLVNPSPVYAE